MAWTDAQIAATLAHLKESSATLNEVARLLRTHAERMDNLVNQQLPELRSEMDSVRKSVSLTATRLDYLANTAGPAVKDDVDAIRDHVAGADSAGTTAAGDTRS
jgi:hypothetical protein